MPILAMGEPLLRVEHLSAGYGKMVVLRDITLSISAGEVVGLVGPNGAGKTTLLSAISGLIRRREGGVAFAGAALAGGDAMAARAAGLVHVVDGHRVFTQLSVEENILLAGYGLPKAARQARAEEVLQHFPEISAKRAEKAGALSGGQRQMLCIAQGLMGQPKLIMLDEPSAGLAPILVDRVVEIVGQLAAGGMAVLIVDQLINRVIDCSDRVLVLDQGEITVEARTDAPGVRARIDAALFA